MNWGLFCQIEVILLTIGLVVSFVIAIQQNAKDNSFAKRVLALATAFEESLKKKEEKK